MKELEELRRVRIFKYDRECFRRVIVCKAGRDT
jgi:hypothetical protein